MVLSMEKWKGKIAVVTGASAGIGATIAEQLVKYGIIVVGLARRPELIAKNSQQLKNYPGKLHGVKCDITQSAQIIATFKNITETYGPVHILINCAGVVRDTRLIDGDINAWKETIDTNMLGLSICTREAIAVMKKHNIDGHIININSVLGHRIPGYTIYNVYPATKHGVTALTEVFRLELRKMESKIKITSLSPGMTKSDIFNAGNFKENHCEIMPAMDREDVADAVIYALSTAPHVEVRELTIQPLGLA